MSRTNRNNVRSIRHDDCFFDDDLDFHPELVPALAAPAHPDTRAVLDAVIRGHRWQLVATARHQLGNRRRDAEDLVQEICLEALEGQLALSPDPSEALEDLLREVVGRSKGGGG
jgi:hypothetical protein